jgi:dihydrofolate synthase/folylpolyglutamate synthase
VSTAQSTLDYLYGLQKFGVKLGLSNIRELLRSSDNPQKTFRSVHIAGTNGKGSTSSMIGAVLASAGYKVGLYTSPHLVRFNERIRINGVMISDRDLVRYVKMFRSRIDTLNATFFEATTAIAFKYFADANIDFGVIETGLGGRLDATNVLVPEVCVITSIGKDHTEQLGTSLQKIAFEKGGIIKRGVGCVIGVRTRSALQELRKIAERKHSRLIDVNKVASVKSGSMKDHDTIWTIETEENSYSNLRIPLVGNFQARNASIALVALEQLQTKGIKIPRRAITQGFQKLQRLSGIRGRFEILQSRPTIVLDVGHNPDGISATVDALRSFRYKRLLLVFGVMKDKDYETMIRIFSTLHPVVFAVHADLERALSADVISKSFRTMNCVARSFRTTAGGVQAGLRTQRGDDLLLICGSHYVAGEALPVLHEKLRRKSS